MKLGLLFLKMTCTYCYIPALCPHWRKTDSTQRSRSHQLVSVHLRAESTHVFQLLSTQNINKCCGDILWVNMDTLLTSELSSCPSSSSDRSNFTSSPAVAAAVAAAAVLAVAVFEADILSVDAPGSADNSSAASSNSTDVHQEWMGVSNSGGATMGTGV